jgi:thymidylate synthase ThyX
METVQGKFGIKATILADSIASSNGVRFTTFEIEYPRIILAELNTHRMLAKNSHSSRAIPFAKMIEQLTGRPVRFGQANPGMQDKGEEFAAHIPYWNDEEDRECVYTTPEQAWEAAKRNAIGSSKGFFEAGYHKQVYNRLTEPFQMMRTVISGTEWGNFWWLRDHEAADPTLHELASTMRKAMEASTPRTLEPGEWHLPYIRTERHGGDGEILYFMNETALWDECLGLEDARKVSAARCAAVSFRNENYDLTKSVQVFDRLVGDDRKHASAFEHQATPMEDQNPLMEWQEGISHMDRKGRFWSGPLRGWIQFRKLIPGENYETP